LEYTTVWPVSPDNNDVPQSVNQSIRSVKSYFKVYVKINASRW